MDRQHTHSHAPGAPQAPNKHRAIHIKLIQQRSGWALRCPSMAVLRSPLGGAVSRVHYCDLGLRTSVVAHRPLLGLPSRPSRSGRRAVMRGPGVRGVGFGLRRGRGVGFGFRRMRGHGRGRRARGQDGKRARGRDLPSSQYLRRSRSHTRRGRRGWTPRRRPCRR